ncbi:MAG: type I restriction-modification system endonuclease [Spirulina sp.]
MMVSSNFAFLKVHDLQLVRLGSQAEQYFSDERSLLLAMATGTGKTKTSIALIYRLLKSKRFRRILFLVDRTILGDQAHDAFCETRMESLQSFADIFEVKSLKDMAIDRDTKVHISTVQALVSRLLYPADGMVSLTAGQYDCIVVDECHRGYLLDREMSDPELEFRNFDDYVSKYRKVVEFFDAVKIGLTATPALHTSEIFGKPVFKYSYREAVIDGYLIDCEPPTKIITELAEEGIHWEAGEAVEYFDPLTGQIDLTETPDELNFEVGQFNKRVINSNFDRVICDELAQYIDPSLDEKTLIFCVRDDHCDRIVDTLKQAFAEYYGEVEDDAIVKITGKADKPKELTKRFKNEKNPKVAVTVDLLTTGVDVPSICNLVFLRRVNSRILYEQMIGRATRRCDEIGKEVFRIFDAVNLYENLERFTEMKPVAIDPNISFEQLFAELDAVSAEEGVNAVVEQLLAKIQRKRQRLREDLQDEIERVAGIPLAEFAPTLRQQTLAERVQWLRERRNIAQMLDRQDGGRQPIFISTEGDRVRRIERGYGEGIERPDDYLDGFSAFLRENMNRIPALLVVTQRPKELTRQDLKALRLELEQAGFTEVNLQTAWREKTNEDIAASIIGFIRQAALGDALIAYGERVDRALKKLSAGRSWTPVQRKWLERIAKQLKQEKIVDPSSLDEGAFRSQGGLKKIDKVFNGEIEAILLEIKDYLWQEAN